MQPRRSGRRGSGLKDQSLYEIRGGSSASIGDKCSVSPCVDNSGYSLFVTSATEAAERNRLLVQGLTERGSLQSPLIEEAFLAVERHHFLPGVPLERVYADEAIVTRTKDGIPISSSSQPAIVAMMLEQLDLQPGQCVLEIGAGTGYNAALMSRIVGSGGHVTTIDINPGIMEAARAHLEAAGITDVRVVCADGASGFVADAPYDRIIATVGVWDIAPAWIEQLSSAGRLLVPLSLRGMQKCIAFRKTSSHLESVSVRDCGFMSMRGECSGPQQQLHLDEDLVLSADDVSAISSKEVEAWLRQGGTDTATDVRARADEIFGSLTSWLALHRADYCSLGALQGGGRELVPPLLRFGEAGASMRTSFGYVSRDGLELLAFRGGELPCELSDEAEDDLVVRKFGGAASAARSALREQIDYWDRAGRPSSTRLKVRVIPLGGAPSGNPDVIVRKRWSDVAVSWSEAPFHFGQ